MIKNLYFTSLLNIPQKELDVSILSFFVPSESIGIYRMAKNFMVALWAFVDGIVLLVFPEIVKFSEKKHWLKLFDLLKKVTVYGFLFSLTVFSMVWCLLPFFIDVFLSEEFTGAYQLALIMFAGAFIWLPLCWAYPVAISISDSKSILNSSIFCGITSTILYFIFLPVYGLIGSAVIYTLSPAVLSISIIVFSLYRIGFKGIDELRRNK